MSRTEYLDSWRISPLLGLRGFQQVIIKTREGTEDRRPSQKETAREELRPVVVDEPNNLNPHRRDSRPYAPKLQAQLCAQAFVHFPRRGC